MNWFSKKKKDPDAELKEIIKEVDALITKEVVDKKLYKVNLRIHWKNGSCIDYWYHSVPGEEVKGKNARQWFKPFFKWFFHTNEKYYYQSTTDGGLGINRDEIHFFQASIEEIKL